MRDWGEQDMAGVIAWVERALQPAHLLMVGHSIGGQLTGLADNNACIDGMLLVSSQSGYWRLYQAPERYHLYLMWRFLFPALAHIFGYLPARRLGLGEDLPKGSCWNGRAGACCRNTWPAIQAWPRVHD